MSGASAGSSSPPTRGGATSAASEGRSASVDDGGGRRPAIRPLRWWELPSAVALEPLLFGADAWSAAMFWSELAQRATRHFVATWDGGVMTAYAGSAATADEAWVQTIGVAPAYRRQGLATALLADLTADARRRGAPTLWLEVGAGNTAAQVLYARHGFETVGRRRGYYQATGEDALVMRARL